MIFVDRWSFNQISTMIDKIVNNSDVRKLCFDIMLESCALIKKKKKKNKIKKVKA